MPVTPYFQPAFQLSGLGAKLVNMSSDTFNVGLIASGTLAARAVTENYVTVADLLANNGSALTEVAGGGYARLALASVTWAQSGLVVTFDSADPSWSPNSFTAEYAWIHDETASSGTDATRRLVCILDFGGSLSVNGLVINAAGIGTFTAAV